MATITANKSLDMLNIPTTFEFISAPNLPTPTLISGLTPSGNLQRYFGSFNLLDIAVGKYDTSVVTGFEQYAGATTATALEYQLTGVSVNGAFLVDALGKINPDALLSEEALKGNDLINGSNFDDTLLGYGADDTIYANLGSDTVQGDLGNDLLYGAKGADSLEGGDGNDSIFAGQGNDTLIGGLGADYLKDGKGSDLTTGGAGADTFSLSAGTDVVTDFSIADGDKIELPAGVTYTFEGSNSNVLFNLAANGSFVGGQTTLLNVNITDFTAANPILPA